MWKPIVKALMPTVIDKAIDSITSHFTDTSRDIFLKELEEKNKFYARYRELNIESTLNDEQIEEIYLDSLIKETKDVD
jgi:hypothetical protein